MSVYLHDTLFTPLQIVYMYVCVDYMIQVQVYRTCVNFTIMVNFWDVAAIIGKQNKKTKQKGREISTELCYRLKQPLSTLLWN